MKRFLSLMLFLAIILSTIYIPTASASVDMPDGSVMSSGESSASHSGYTAISDAKGFKAISAGGKYYLTSDIDLTEEGVDFTTLAGNVNSASAIILDGCGYTVTTNKPLIEEIPGGGTGKHSEIRNLVIKGNITVSVDEITAYENGLSVGALAGKANGGIFESIVNYASITVSGATNANVRVGGIVGSVFNDKVTFTNCVNHGDLYGYVGTGSANYGMGGIIGFVANGSESAVYEAIFDYCKNTGSVTNASTAASNVFAGGLFGNKRTYPTVTVTNSENIGEISSNGSKGEGVYQALYGSSALTNITLDFSAISNATELMAISAGNKYYLTQSIDLTASGVNFTTIAGGNNSASAVTLDGCGYTITTNKPLIEELWGGGAGKHSVIKNLVINGSIEVSSSDITAYDNGMSVGALVGKANGGIFENIVNNATLTVTDAAEVRAAGLVGAVFNESTTFKKCVNNGAITASVASSNNKHAVSGITAYLGVSGILFEECANNASITNKSDSDSGAYAGGIIGVKADASTKATMRDCVNNGKIRAKTAYGKYYAISSYKNIDFITVTDIKSAEDFAKIKGNGEYRLNSDITLTESNSNEFSGVLYGNGYTVTSKKALFKKDKGATLDDVNVNITSLNIKGRPLDSFAVIASTTDNAEAKAIVDFVKSKYGITLPIKASSEGYVGNAIHINLGNTYGNIRYGFDYGLDDNGDIQIYLDETSDNISSFVSNFLKNKLTTNKSAYDFSKGFGQKSFTYLLPEGSNQGYTFNESEDVEREITKGVISLRRTYTTSTGIEVVAYIVILKADAAAHIEVQAAELTKVSACENDNSDNCGNLHGLEPKGTSEFVAEMEAEGKNVYAAINAGFFMKAAGCYAPWGMQIVNGVVDAEPRDNTDKVKVYSNWFGITKDGSPVISTLSGYRNTYKGEILYGVGSRYLSIVNGKYKKLSSGAYDARTAIGYNAKGDIAMVVVAGNNEIPETPGATLSDMAQIFMDLDIDITDALNLDGGGSSTMVVEDENGKIQLESPLLSGSSERKLGNILAIVAD